MGESRINRLTVLVVGSCLSASVLFADFSYEQTTRITGGAMMGMMKVAGAFSRDAAGPMTTTVIVKGDRMVRISRQHTEITDLAAETMTSIDMQRKTYSVMTFAEMKQMMEEASAKMKDKNGGADMKFTVEAKATGLTKTIAGFPAKELQITVKMEGQDKNSGQTGGMTIQTDIWMATGIAGYDEVRAFNRRMAEKMAWAMGNNMGMMMAPPGSSAGMAEVAKEMAKIEGVPVLTLMRMGAAGQPMPQPGDAAQPQQQQQQTPNAGNAAGSAAGSGIADRLPGLGRFGGFGRKKKQDQDQDQQQQTQQQPQAGGQQPPPGGGGALMESTTETTGFSSGPVDPSKFEVPAGFKKVDPDKNRGRGR